MDAAGAAGLALPLRRCAGERLGAQCVGYGAYLRTFVVVVLVSGLAAVVLSWVRNPMRWNLTGLGRKFSGAVMEAVWR